MMKMKAIFLSLILVLNFSSVSNSQNIPNSFADLAEKLMPSVVNISTTQTVVTRSNPFPNFQFPPGSPFGDMFKEFGTPQERQSSALGSGFIIDEKGILVTTMPSLLIIKPDPKAEVCLSFGTPNSLNISSKGDPGGN